MDSNKSPVIFVIDKNPIHNSLIKYHLNINRIYNVHTFHSGAECLYRFQRGTLPDFIVMDYDISDYTGFDFLKVVEQLPVQPRVIFFSSYDDPILAVRLLDAGASDFIVKTSRLDYGITELIKNLKFMVRSEAQVRNG